MNSFLSSLLLLVTFLSFGQEPVLPETKEAIEKKIEQLIKRSENQNLFISVSNLQEALVYARGLEDEFLMANVSVALANLYSKQENYQAAEVNMLRAINNYRNLEDQESLGNAYRVYAMLFISQGKYDRAKDYLQLAEHIFDEQKLVANKALVQKEMARLALAEQMPNNAILLLENAVGDLKKISDKASYIDGLQLLGQSYLETFNYDAAQERLLQAYELANVYNIKSQKADIALLLAQVYSAKDNPDEAYQYLQISNNINKELRELVGDTELDKDTAKQLEEKDKVITNLSEMNLEQERNIRRNTLLGLLSVAFIAILSLLTLSLYRNNRIRERANELLLEQRDELKLAKEKAEQATKAKAEFLSTITHELRTPLYAVTGLTKLLMDENPSKAQKQHLNSLKFSGEYLLSLINNILDLNKLEAKKMQLRNDTFKLKKRLKEVIIALKHSADKRSNTLTLEYDSEIPKFLKGDALKLSQVFVNLVGNAIKFTENGKIRIRVNQLLKDSTHSTILFEVIDNGVGISKEQMTYIFDSFSQGSLDINRKFGGTGLGLSIVQQIMELMNSKVEIESTLGKGSKFSFKVRLEHTNTLSKETIERVPLGDLEKLTAPSAFEVPEMPDEKENIELHSEYLKGQNILVVEDNKINQMITRKILQKHGAMCEVSENGEKAIALARDLDFDLILMDIHMPGIGGVEATKKIREFDKNLPIVALTAVTLEDNGKEFYDAGFNAIIPKPYDENKFFKVIGKCIKTSSKTEQLNS